jgi:hypothetical protein
MNGRAALPHPLLLLQRRSAVAVSIIHVAVAFSCAVTPLLDTLGYESAVVFGLLAAWVGALHPLSLLREWRTDGVPHSPTGAWWRLTVTGMLLLIPPFIILTGNALFVRNCALFHGALFWLLIPFVTVAFVNAVLLFFDALTGRHAAVLYYFLLLLLLFQPFLQIYTQPRIFAYNHIFGMFLGFSWDQSQPPFATLAMFRLTSAAYVALLLVVTATVQRYRRGALDRASRRRNLLLFFPVLLLLLLGHLRGNHLGFDNSYTHLHRVLGSEYQLENVLLVHDAGAVDSAAVHAMAEEHLFQQQAVARELEVEWEDRIVSWIYPDRLTKKRLLGTGSSDLARPWRAEMHLTLDSWAATLRHELVHVVGARFGPAPFGVPFLRVFGLTEGLAMAVEWSWGNRTLHEFSAGMMAQGLLPHARTCMSTTGFLGGSSATGYVASGSLTRWLIDSLGIGVVRQAYARDDLQGVTGMDYEEMNSRWRVFLAGVRREEPDSLAVAYAFRRPSIFRAVCPRVLTGRNRAAARALQDGDAEQAARLYAAADLFAPNARSAFGLVAACYEQRQWDSVVALTTRYLDDSTRAYSLLPMLLWQGAAHYMRDDRAAAARALARLCEERPPGWPTGHARRMLAALSTRTPDRHVLETDDERVVNARSTGNGAGALRDSLMVLLVDILRRNPERGDSQRKASLRGLLDRAPGDPVILGEYLRAHADDARGRRYGLDVRERIAGDTLPDELRLLVARMYYRERDWQTALHILRQLPAARAQGNVTACGTAKDESMRDPVREYSTMTTAAFDNEIAEWIERCEWQIKRSGNVRD